MMSTLKMALLVVRIRMKVRRRLRQMLRQHPRCIYPRYPPDGEDPICGRNPVTLLIYCPKGDLYNWRAIPFCVEHAPYASLTATALEEMGYEILARP